MLSIHEILQKSQNNSDLFIIGYEELDDLTGTTAQTQERQGYGIDVETAPVSLPIIIQFGARSQGSPF